MANIIYAYKDYFDLSEFLIDPKMREPDAEIPLHVAVKVQRYHKPILNPIRHVLGVPVIISKNSGFRPLYWEKNRGRDGTSQHCFGAGEPKSEIMDHWGACDLTCKEEMFEQLLKLLIKSDYTRIALYPEDRFIHADFKGDHRGLWIVETVMVEQDDGTKKPKKKWKYESAR